MRRKIQTDSGITSPAINGSGQRKCPSWIDAFVKYTDNLESSEIYRKWAAISILAAVLEQKVYVTTSSPLYPNLYVFLVGRAGVGKTRPIMAAMNFVSEIPDMHLGATSMTAASMVDHMAEAKRTIIQMPEPPLEYNTLYLCADELSAFMSQYDKEIVAVLTTFFDRVPYSQGRRKNDLRIKINRPLLNILCGSTEANLIELIPEYAWKQGFTSRIFLIHASEDKPVIDVFNTPFRDKPPEMIHDLKLINNLVGQMGWTEEYATAMHNWKKMGHPPKPNHPRLESYTERRFSHLIKLSMIASVDRGADFTLRKEDFNRAMGWLLEAELNMVKIFQGGGGQGSDSAAMDEIAHFVGQHSDGVSEIAIARFAKNYVPAYNVMRVIETMEFSGMLIEARLDPKTGKRILKAP